MKLIVDVPLLEGTDLKDLQAAALVSLVWKAGDEQGSRARIAPVTSVDKFRQPHRDVRDVAEIEDLRQQLDYERYNRPSPPPPPRPRVPSGSRAPSYPDPDPDILHRPPPE